MNNTLSEMLDSQFLYDDLPEDYGKMALEDGWIDFLSYQKTKLPGLNRFI
jgi:hypothetical protein